MEAVKKKQKWGNNLGINIPPFIASGLSLREGIFVSVKKKENKIILEPSNPNHTYSLTDMLSEITEDNIHKEMWNLL